MLDYLFKTFIGPIMSIKSPKSGTHNFNDNDFEKNTCFEEKSFGGYKDAIFNNKKNMFQIMMFFS